MGRVPRKGRCTSRRRWRELRAAIARAIPGAAHDLQCGIVVHRGWPVRDLGGCPHQGKGTGTRSRDGSDQGAPLSARRWNQLELPPRKGSGMDPFKQSALRFHEELGSRSLSRRSPVRGGVRQIRVLVCSRPLRPGTSSQSRGSRVGSHRAIRVEEPPLQDSDCHRLGSAGHRDGGRFLGPAPRRSFRRLSREGN